MDGSKNRTHITDGNGIMSVCVCVSMATLFNLFNGCAILFKIVVFVKTERKNRHQQILPYLINWMTFGRTSKASSHIHLYSHSNCYLHSNGWLAGYSIAGKKYEEHYIILNLWKRKTFARTIILCCAQCTLNVLIFVFRLISFEIQYISLLFR